MSKRLVIFGAGYIGRQVALEALKRGFEVSALTRNPDAASELEKEGVMAITGLLQDNMWHDLIEPGPDFVVNCVSGGKGGLEGYQKSYIEGQESVLEWCARQPPLTYLYTSSTSVYTQTDGEEVTEDMACTPASAAGKLLCESEGMVLEAQLPRTFILRLSGIYGPGRHYLLNQVIRGDVIPGTGDHFLNLIHREDVVRAIWACYDSEHKGGVLNVSDGNPSTKQEVAEWMAKELGCPPPAFDPNLPSERQTRRSSARGVPNRKISNERLRSEVGWKPRFPTFKDGFRSIIEQGNMAETAS